ncbi:MAG: type II secretion system protein [Candidatus Omnitrophota bacterium]
MGIRIGIKQSHGLTLIEHARKKIIMKKAFTIIEVLFVVAVIALLLGAISPFLGAFHNSWQKVDRRNEVLQNARVGMDKMLRDIRQAESFDTINNNRLIFTDVDGNSIEYRKHAGSLKRNSVIMIEDISDLTFTYYDANGDETNDEDEVRTVNISLTVDDAESVVGSLTVAATAFMRSLVVGIGEGYTFSKNADFSTSDTVFNTTDTFYIKVWSENVDYTDLDYATCQLKKGSTKVDFNLTNNGDGYYTGSRSLSGFATGNWTVNIDVKDNGSGRYKPSPAPTIRIQ